MRRFAFSWSALAIVLLAALTVVLALAALRGPASPTATPAPTGSALSDPPTVSEKPGKEEGSVPDVEPLLSVVDVLTAYRGTVGSCAGGGSTLERTIDGGVTWEKVTLPPVNALTEVSAGTGVAVTLVGSGEECALASWTSTNAGVDWNGPGATAGFWLRIPKEIGQIQTPAGTVRQPCPDRSAPVREVEGMDQQSGALLCATGEVRTSADGGASWTNAAPVPVGTAVALAWDNPAEGWVLIEGSDTCPGFQLLRTIDTGASWATGGCVGDAADTSSRAAAPGLDFVDPLVGLASLDGGTYFTEDGGATWQLARR